MYSRYKFLYFEEIMEQRGHRFEEKIKVINRFTEPLIYATAYPGFAIECQPQMGVPTYYSAKICRKLHENWTGGGIQIFTM